jgi:Co/Zn/Cd efflux system component
MSPTKSADGLTSYQHGNGTETSEPAQPQETTNEYVLGVAFWTFLLFLIAEAFFAVIAGSQAMLEDAEAMTVDALTYLFNLLAERVKNRPYTDEEKRLPPSVLDYRREKLRLYLELIPPLLSVTTLLIVTALATKDALESLAKPKSEDDTVNVNLMIIFSAGNMLLDVVNVACFAKAHQAYGLSTVRREPLSHSYRSARKMEMEGLLQKDYADNLHSPSEDADESEGPTSINLNMCSAWTVSGMVLEWY